MLPPRAAGSKGRQNEYLKWKRNRFSALHIFQIIATNKTLIQWVNVISVRGSIVIARSWRQKAQLRYCLYRTEQPVVKAIWKLCIAWPSALFVPLFLSSWTGDFVLACACGRRGGQQLSGVIGQQVIKISIPRRSFSFRLVWQVTFAINGLPTRTPHQKICRGQLLLTWYSKYLYGQQCLVWMNAF